MDELFGREDECGRLRELIERSRGGHSGVLVLYGDPGAGKTALLDYVQAVAEAGTGTEVEAEAKIAGAGAFEVARFDAVESEAQLGFAALHQLLRPGLGALATLPGPQRAALGQVFGLIEGTRPPDRFLVALASLGLLAARAVERPLLCVVDDAHCLDQESAAVLAFIARRLYADRVAMVFAVREPWTSASADAFDGLPRLRIGGLPDSAARGLLAVVAGGALERSVRDRVVAETGGNPLAMIEAAGELTADQLAGQAPLPDPLPLGRQLEALYSREVRALPEDTQELLLAAAADPVGDPVLLWRAGIELGFDVRSAEPAERRQLISIHDSLRFRHPLVRSAVYYGASLARRQRVHAALATATGVIGEPDRRASHLAAAATGLDEQVAGDLERAGERERRRGGWSAASTLFARAGALSAEQPTRARRLLAAAEASVTAGAAGRAQALLDEAAAYRDDRRHNSQVQRVQARIHRLLRQPAAATSALLAAAAQAGPVDSRLARDVLVEAIVQAQISGRLAPEGTGRGDVARAARVLPLAAAVAATSGDLLLDADTELHLAGLRAAGPLLHRAVDAVRHETSRAPELFQWLAAACADATVLGDDVALHELAWRLDAEARAQGAVIPMALALSHTGLSELVAGMLSESERCFDQRSALDEARGDENSLGALLIAAWRGQEKPARDLLDAVAREAAASGQGYLLVFADYARCVLELGLGRYREAYTSLAAGIDAASQLKFALADLVEAAVRCGEDRGAREPLNRLAELADVCPVPRTLGYLARAQALIAGDDPAAEAMYLRAIEHHENTRGPAHRARSHLVYGEWLRRVRRSKQARAHLRTAYELFTAMGAEAFAMRAGQELSAAGEPVPSRLSAGHDADLTAQEARVAHLAAAGATNAEIAARLYLSVNTVDYHLRKVFRKLGIHSRRELIGAANPLLSSGENVMR